MENRNTDNTQSYYLKSLMIPKQSTVIGIVRYLLLMQAGNEIFKENKIQDKNEAKNLIGERSYEVSLSDFELGKIQSISPIYILHNKKFYFLSPSINQKAEIKNVGKIAVIDHNHDFKNMQSALISNEGDTQQLDNVFINHFQSNNNKNDTNETRSDAFFKTCYYKLKDGIGFGITIEVDDDVMINTTDSFYAKIGGENKLFKIECIQGENNYEAQAHEALKCWKQKTYPQV
ncbi:MAG: hypothetical protein IPN14_17025 [Bacteroidetes bacterium]|nr:hypothetical protein [Bacteroidota bacterium]